MAPHLFRPRALLVQVVFDELDDAGNVVNEVTTQPQRVFPQHWTTLPEQVARVAEAVNAQAAQSTGRPVDTE